MSTALINAAEQFVAWHKDVNEPEDLAGMLYYFADIFAEALAESQGAELLPSSRNHAMSDAVLLRTVARSASNLSNVARQQLLAISEALEPQQAPLTEHDLPRHPWSDAEDPIVWAACEEQAILAWGNALLGIKPAEDAE